MSKKPSVKNKRLLVVFLSTSVLVVGIFFYYHQTTALGVLGTTNSTTTVGAKEFFIPLGFGTVNNANDWTDVPGMQATVDSSQYPNVKQVLLEITAYSPNGNQTIWMRLRNNDYYSYPQVSMGGTGPNLLTSSPFSISPGPKTYYVQLKTQLGFPVQIYQARLHITTY